MTGTATLHAFLGAEPAGEGKWTFKLERELHGAFGGAFGGAVSASMLVAARSVAPGRTPVAIDCHFLRQLPAGTATAEATVVRAGRTMSAVAVELTGSDGKPGSHAWVTLADATALHPLWVDAGPANASPRYEAATAWGRPPVEIPIIDTLAPRSAKTADGSATVLRRPWSEPGTTPELACVAGDLCVGSPVSEALVDSWVPHPNPDVSLRFSGREAGPELTGVGRLASLAGGVATVAIEVRSGADLLAVGVSCSLLLPPS